MQQGSNALKKALVWLSLHVWVAEELRSTDRSM